MSQNQLIKKHLQKGKSLTPMEALRKWGCWALSSRIAELRKNMNIKTEMVTKGNKTFAKYSL